MCFVRSDGGISVSDRKFFAALIAALALFAAPAFAETTLIYAGTVLVKPGERPLKEQTIVVTDGKIAEIKAGYIAPADGQTVIDLKDKFVLPGLIDTHVHLLQELGPDDKLHRVETSDPGFALDGAYNAMLNLKAGFTTVADMGETVGGEAIFALRNAIRDGKIPGPRILAAGSIISPTGGHGQVYGYRAVVMDIFHSSGVCDGVDDCRRAVRLQVSRSADFIKFVATGGVLSDTKAGLGQQFTDEEMKAIVDTAHTFGRKVFAHAHGVDGINAALRAGVDGIEHGTYLDETSIRLFRQHNAWLTPTVIAGITVGEYAKTGDFMSPAVAEKALKVGPIIQDALRRAHAGGVKISFGTDTGVGRHGTNGREFKLMVDAGFTPMEAIVAATLRAAEKLGIEGDAGTIEAGRAADIIATAKSPLDDITELERVVFVMRGGVVYKQPD